MEKEKITHVVFVIDKSGSMSGLEDDTIGGFNSTLKKQQEAEGICRVTTALFDTDYTLLHDNIDSREVKPMTSEDYCPGGCTALLDALGKTIHCVAKSQKSTDEKARADKVIFIIITDGAENSSVEYNNAQIKALVEKEQKDNGWEFIFLGANIDAFSAAQGIGIRKDRTQNYMSDSEGTVKTWSAVAGVVGFFRKTGAVDEKWGDEIEKDFKTRGKK